MRYKGFDCRVLKESGTQAYIEVDRGNEYERGWVNKTEIEDYNYVQTLMKIAECNDCGMPYGSDDWIDTVLSNEQWKMICPNDALLCANCIIKRASKLDGITIAKMELIF